MERMWYGGGDGSGGDGDGSDGDGSDGDGGGGDSEWVSINSFFWRGIGWHKHESEINGNPREQ